MARLEWDLASERLYEVGVDRGVLYISSIGYPWNGIISVAEASSGGEARPFYFDGFKYLNLSSAEEFEATIEAFNAPREFAQCDGLGLVQNGLYADQQRRKKFGFSYRTKIGNDTLGDEYGFKIHLVYGCMADPTDKSYTTQGAEQTPTTFSWHITTVPQVIPNMRPTAHFVIDSRGANPTTIAALEDMIYGSDTNAPFMPTALDLVAMFSA